MKPESPFAWPYSYQPDPRSTLRLPMRADPVLTRAWCPACGAWWRENNHECYREGG